MKRVTRSHPWKGRPVPRAATLAVACLLLAVAAAGPARAADSSATAAPLRLRDAVPPAPPPETGSAGPIFAVEDTIPVPSALLPVYEVTASRVTLDEILDRVARGEARRDSLMQDQAYTMVAAMTYLDADGRAPRDAKRKYESSTRVYKKQPDRIREVPLRTVHDLKSDDDMSVNASPTMREQLVSFAFEPRARARFRFAIAGRHLIGEHVVYVLSFEPRSRVDPLPSGRVWVDTHDFVIVREEFWYRDRSPAPMFFKSIDSCVLERSQVDGRWWVLTRLVARVQLTSLARFMGRVARENLPPTIDFTLVQTDWQINQGLDDALFTESRP
jgi:hypothetical protein